MVKSILFISSNVEISTLLIFFDVLIILFSTVGISFISVLNVIIFF